MPNNYFLGPLAKLDSTSGAKYDISDESDDYVRDDGDNDNTYIVRIVRTTVDLLVFCVDGFAIFSPLFRVGFEFHSSVFSCFASVNQINLLIKDVDCKQ